jgi:kynureninase
MTDLLAYRDRFPILEHTTYLINHSLGAMPAAVEERVAEYARTWAERGIRAWGEGWWTTPLTVGDQIGRIVGAPPGTVCMHQNVSIAEAVVLSCFQRLGARNRIVYERENFPSVRYVYQARDDLEVVATDDVVAAIDERTLLVPVQHVLFKSAEIQDVERIVSAAHDAGAYVVLDAYQSAGCVPLDVTALDVDFAVGGSVKWLCGGPGAGWLYVRPDLIERLEPAVTGWQAHARPFAFEPELEYADGIARFLTGTPNVPALYACTPGYDLIEEIGVDRIRASSLRQTQRLIDGADARGFGVRSPREPERRGGTVTVDVPDFEAVHKELGERQILCDFRPDAGIRLGPHYFNTDDELDFALDQIAEILATGAYERWLGATARF